MLPKIPNPLARKKSLSATALLWVSFALFCAGWTDAIGRTEANQIVATQAIGGPYQFTDSHYLLEVASGIQEMGSNFIKFTLHGRNYVRKPYHLDKMEEIKSMKDLLTKHPVYRELMEMDFRFYHIWATQHARINWGDGVSKEEAEAVYKEFYELTEHLLREYAGTGKVFFLGHWEGDWLLTNTNPDIDPTPERINGFAQYLNVRQKAVNDARNANADLGYWVYHYTEVNQVWKGIDGKRATLTNSVLPLVDVDYVSYSSYDVINRPNMREALHEALDHIESQLKPRNDIQGKRVFVGEYGIKASIVDYDHEEHDRRNREVTAAILEWGCPFAVYWQFYCNETHPDGSGHHGFWLVDDQQNKVKLYHTFQGYYSSLEDFIESETRRSGRRPGDAAIRDFAVKYFRNE